MSRSTRGALLAAVCALAVGGHAQAKTEAAIISVAKLRSGTRYELPVAEANAVKMQSTLQAIGVTAIHPLSDANVNRSSVRSLLSDQLPAQLTAGDLLILYYAGHGSYHMVAGVPTRVYFTHEARQRRKASGDADRWEEDGVFSDLDLRDWLKPLHDQGVKTLFLRECCFNGGGYSGELQQAGFVHGPANAIDSVATYELSACSFDQAAYATTRDGTTLGVFTAVLADALSARQPLVTLADVASRIKRDVPALQKNQTPVVGGLEKDRLGEVKLVDRTKVTLVIHAKDAMDHHEIEGARVSLQGLAQPALTPATLFDVARGAGKVYPWLEFEGYVPQSVQIDLDPNATTVKRTVDLEPEYAVIAGLLRESSGQLGGVKVGFETLTPLDPRQRLFDTEVSPDSDGRFALRVPPRLAYRVVVFSGGQVLAKSDVNAGKPLEPLRGFDRARNAPIERRPYDCGSVTITMARSGPTDVEKQFDKYFSQGQALFENGETAGAKNKFEVAKEVAASADVAAKVALERRVDAALSQVARAEREQTLAQLEQQAGTLLEHGDLDQAQARAEEALAIDQKQVWAKAMLKDIELERKRLAAAELDRRAKVAADVDKSKASASGNSNAGAPRAIAGCRFTGMNEQGMAEYTHDMTGMVLVYIPGGTFTMGSPDTEAGRGQDEVQHQVTLSPYFIGKYEVTQEVWEKVMGSNPSSFKAALLPVESVSWNDATAFCDKVGLKLPTEAQWEFACRAGNSTRFSFGDADDQLWQYANYLDRSNTNNTRGQDKAHDDHFDKTAPVGSFKPNRWGLYDMHGNVREWCRDQVDFSRVKPDTYRDGVRDPVSLQGSERVHRGGSWDYSAGCCRSAYRFAHEPGWVGFDLGIRVSLRP